MPDMLRYSSESVFKKHDETETFLELRATRLASRRSALTTTIFVVSLIANVGLITIIAASGVEHSNYAGLTASLQVPFQWSTEYATTNLTEAARLWDEINFDSGLIAMPNAWSDTKGLPRAQSFPWDREKGIYLLNGYHALHCLKNIHRAIREYELGLEQSLPLGHITHCIDSLRDDVICQADDTPRYTTSSKSPESAVGQIRQCRDWRKLEDWAKQMTSCYRYISHKADHINQFKRFMFCPRDSEYWPAVRAHFRKPENWFADDYDAEVEAATISD